MKFFYRFKPLCIFILLPFTFALMAVGTFAGHMLFQGFNSHWFGVGAGVLLMLLALAVHFIFGKKIKLPYIFSGLYLISAALNYLGAGVAISSYYHYKDMYFALDDAFYPMIMLIFAMLCFSVLLLLFRQYKVILLSLGAAALAAALVLFAINWAKSGEILYSYGFFLILNTLAYLSVYALSVNHDDRKFLVLFSSISFYTFAIITAVIILILSWSDIYEGLGGSDGEKKKKKS